LQQSAVKKVSALYWKNSHHFYQNSHRFMGIFPSIPLLNKSAKKWLTFDAMKRSDARLTKIPAQENPDANLLGFFGLLYSVSRRHKQKAVEEEREDQKSEDKNNKKIR
jgi:hypothetical protein